MAVPRMVLWRLLGVVETRRKKVSPDAEPVITDTAPAIVKVDAGGAFSPAGIRARASTADTEKARHSGIAGRRLTAVCTFRRCLPTLELLTEAGWWRWRRRPAMRVAPAGGTQPLLALTR